MNKELLSKIADWLEAGAPEAQNNGLGFDMRDVISEKNGCNTACCIAGAAISFEAPHLIFNPIGFSSLWNVGRDLLGLNEDEALRLFAPWHGAPSLGSADISPARAAKTVRHLIETGEIEWGF